MFSHSTNRDSFHTAFPIRFGVLLFVLFHPTCSKVGYYLEIMIEHAIDANFQGKWIFVAICSLAVCLLGINWAFAWRNDAAAQALHPSSPPTEQHHLRGAADSKRALPQQFSLKKDR